MFSAEYLDTLRNVTNTNLIMLTPLRDLSGNAVDISLNSDSFTVSGATQNGWKMKDKAPAYLFDGTNDWVNIDSG